MPAGTRGATLSIRQVEAPVPASLSTHGNTGAMAKRTPPAQFRQELVGNGEYELLNTRTYQFVSVTAGSEHSVCPSGVRRACTDYLQIEVTEYSGNVQTNESPSQFSLVSNNRARYTPATHRQASRVVQPDRLLLPTLLQPDDDGDFVSGTLVFLVPKGPGHFSFLWQGRHVATFVSTSQGKLYETR
jgi:hypothetical protein